MEQSARTGFLDIALPRIGESGEDHRGRVAILGPGGTSSEQAAHHLIVRFGPAGEQQQKPALFHSYEEAASAVLRGAADLLLVANAYAGISSFYMDTRLQLACAYHFQTPMYGIAIKPGTVLPAAARIASHPAPVPLIRQLLPESIAVKEVMTVDSTSSAALAAVSGRADAALTTQPSAERYGLSFVTRTRPISMLWSVFQRSESQVAVLADEAVG